MSTSSSAGCPAASMARRTAAISDVTPVDVSLCTTHTALIRCCVSSRRRASIMSACTPRRQPSMPGKPRNSGLRPRLRPSFSRAWRSGPVSYISTVIAGAQRVGQRRFPGAGAGSRIDHYGLLVLKIFLMPCQHLQSERTEFRAAMVDSRITHRPQDAVRYRARPRNLQKVTASGMEVELEHGSASSFEFCMQNTITKRSASRKATTILPVVPR